MCRRRYDHSAIFAVDIGALDRAVICAGLEAHVGPVDMTGSDIDRDAIGHPAVVTMTFRSEQSGLME